MTIMSKPPRMPKTEVIDKIRRQVAHNERSPFADILANALSVAPSLTAFRQLARQNPRQYVSMVKELAELNGYAARTEHRRVNIDAASVAAELVNRLGPEAAREQLAIWGLPTSLVPAKGATIDATASESPGEVESGEVSTDDTQ